MNGTYTDRIVLVFPIAEKSRPAAASLQTLTVLDSGREIEDVVPLDLNAVSDYADQFSLGLLAERDSLQAQLTAAQAEIERLTALVPPPRSPRELTPREFLERISDADKVAIMQSTDPRCMAAMWTLFTTQSVDLDSPVLAGLVDALIDAGIEIDEAERARIFA